MSSNRPDSGIRHRLPRGGNLCDFCGRFKVAKLHACKNFQCGDRCVFKNDTGHWAACYLCSSLLLSEDWTALTARVMKEVRKRKDVAVGELRMLRRELAGMHKALSKHMIPGRVMTVHFPLVTRTAIV